MDFSSDKKLPTKRETAALLGLTMALWSNKNHDPVKFQNKIMRLDELPEWLLTGEVGDPYTSAKGSVAVLIGDFWNTPDELEKIFLAIQSSTVILWQVVDQAELDLPYSGRALFKNFDTDATIDNIDAIRKDYQAKINAHTEAIRFIANKREWHYDLIRTDQGLSPVLNRAFHYIGDAG